MKILSIICVKLLICCCLFGSIDKLNVDVIADFDINCFYKYMPNAKQQFNITQKNSLYFYEKYNHDKNLIKILIFNCMNLNELNNLKFFFKKKLVYFLWEPLVFPIKYYDNFSKVYT